MAKLIDRILGRAVEEQRYTFEDWLNDTGMGQYAYGGHTYTLPLQTTYGSTPVEQIGPGFGQYVHNAYRANGVVANMPEFYAAFDVKEGDPLHRPEAVRVKIW